MAPRKTRWTKPGGPGLMLAAIAGSFWLAALMPLYRM